LQELNSNGVTHILNVTREIDNFFPSVFKANTRCYVTGILLKDCMISFLPWYFINESNSTITKKIVIFARKAVSTGTEKVYRRRGAARRLIIFADPYL
jgi:hypothetical protein